MPTWELALGADGAALTLAPRGADLPPIVQALFLAALLLVPVGLIVRLTRAERRLIRAGPALGLLALRLAIVAALWAAVALRPTLIRTQADETPGRVRVAVDLSASMDVRDPQRSPDERSRLARILNVATAAVDELTRRQVAERLLAPEGADLLRRLGEHHEIELIGFDGSAHALDVEHWRDGLVRGAGADATDLASALTPAGAAEKRPLLGVVLLTDGRHTAGPSPVTAATALGRRGVPVFPVLLGSRRAPPDIAVQNVRVPPASFQGLLAPVAVEVRAAGLAAGPLTIEMRINGRPARPEHRRTLRHDGGERTYPVTFWCRADTPGPRLLEVTARAEGQQEITPANNRAAAVLRVGAEKLRVLVADGEARWEYQFLVNALKRRPLVRLERVLFEQPRLGLLSDEQLDKQKHPRRRLPPLRPGTADPEPLSAFDCVIVGDVSPEQLPFDERRRLEQYVARRGGTLVLVAGKRHMPREYTKLGSEDPLLRLLPITAPRLVDPKDGFTLKRTVEGERTPFLQLEPEQPGAAWPKLPPHFWGIAGRRKPGATVLAVPKFAGVSSAEEDPEVGVLVRHAYGAGRVVFVGLESTWRWRYRAGDAYHDPFWTQLVLWAAADGLLPAGDEHVRYGARAPEYVEGQEVEVAVRLGEELPPAGPNPGHARLWRGETVVAVVPLTPTPDRPRWLTGRVRGLPVGAYRITLDLPRYRDRLPAGATGQGSAVRVVPAGRGELFDLASDEALLQTLAERSGGTLYSADEAVSVLDRLAARAPRRTERIEARPWRDAPAVWWALGLLLGLLTIEWVWRKRLGLP